MDFLSAKTLEGKLRVTFHIVKNMEKGVEVVVVVGVCMEDRGGRRNYCAARQRERNIAEQRKRKG